MDLYRETALLSKESTSIALPMALSSGQGAHDVYRKCESELVPETAVSTVTGDTEPLEKLWEEERSWTHVDTESRRGDSRRSHEHRMLPPCVQRSHEHTHAPSVGSEIT